MSHDPWHARAAAAALAEQGTTSAGLSAAEAAQRLASHGPNRLTPPQKRGPLLRFAEDTGAAGVPDSIHIYYFD